MISALPMRRFWQKSSEEPGRKGGFVHIFPVSYGFEIPMEVIPLKRILTLFTVLCLLGGLFAVPAAAADTLPAEGEAPLTAEEVAGELADQVGQSDTERLMDALKDLLATTRAMSDEELSETIRAKAGDMGIPLNDTQVGMLLDLYRQFEALSESELAQKIEDMKNTVRKLRDLAEKAKETKETVDEYAEKAGNLLTRLKALWDSFFA